MRFSRVCFRPVFGFENVTMAVGVAYYFAVALAFSFTD
jgi:hypothetical protein